MILRIPIGGFPSSQETQSAMEALTGDRLLFRCNFEIHPGGLNTAVSVLAERATPSLLIVEVDAPRDVFFDHLEMLANVCDPTTKVILIGQHNDIDLFQELLKNGVSDYLVGPVNAERLRDSISRIYQGMEADSDGRVIAFNGLAGGVGSSVIAHNTANELANLYDCRAVVIDLDVYFGTAALNFNVQPRQTIVDALSQIGRLDDNLLDQFLVLFEERVAILASPASLTLGAQITQESFDALLRAVRPMGDFIILDLPHVWTPWVSDALAAADEVVLVARPDLTNLRNAKNMVEFIGPKRGVEAPTRLVLNQVGVSKRADLTEKDFMDAVAMSPAVSIPYDAEVFGRALNNGEMLSKVAKKSKATVAVGDLAKQVSARDLAEDSETKSIFSIFQKSKS